MKKAFFLLLFLASVCVSAPAPQKKAAKPLVKQAHVIGTWALVWNGTEVEGTCTFHEKGGWSCQWHGQDWIGEWKIVDDVLTVKEALRPVNPNGVPSWINWSVPLPNKSMRGNIIGSGGNFLLVPPLKVPPPGIDA